MSAARCLPSAMCHNGKMVLDGGKTSIEHRSVVGLSYSTGNTEASSDKTQTWPIVNEDSIHSYTGPRKPGQSRFRSCKQDDASVTLGPV